MACFFHSFLCDGRNRQNSKWTPSLFWRTADYWGGGCFLSFCLFVLESAPAERCWSTTGSICSDRKRVRFTTFSHFNFQWESKYGFVRKNIGRKKRGGGGSVVLNSWNTWSFHQNYCVLRVFEKKSGNKHLVLKAWRGSLLFCDPLKTSQGHRWTNPRFHPRRFRETSRHAFKNGQHGWEAIRASFALTPDLLVGVGKGLASD